LMQMPHDLVGKSAWWCNTDSDYTLHKSLRAFSVPACIRSFSFVPCAD
jgi:hypothetical protein